jgi:hypothetical protein
MVVHDSFLTERLAGIVLADESSPRRAGVAGRVSFRIIEQDSARVRVERAPTSTSDDAEHEPPRSTTE